MLHNCFHNRLFLGVKSLGAISSSSPCSLQRFVTHPVCQYSDAKQEKVLLERTITSEDVELFSKVTGDHNVVHKSSDGHPGIVHGALLNGIVSGVIGTKLPGHGTVVLSQTLHFPKPCFIGDTVIISVEITDRRKIISCKYEVTNRLNKAVLMEGEAKLLFKKSIK